MYLINSFNIHLSASYVPAVRERITKQSPCPHHFYIHFVYYPQLIVVYLTTLDNSSGIQLHCLVATRGGYSNLS